MRLLCAVVAGLRESVRETLPDDEATAGAWVGGFCWAFAIHWVLLITVTLGHCWAKGGC